MSYPGQGPQQQQQQQNASIGSVVDSLLNNLRYMDRARTKTDIVNLLAQSRSLTPSVQQLVHNTGQSEFLIALTGTVPIWYKNATYNIPVTIWVPEQYPARPPIPYVTPTREMAIKDRHKHVDLHGVVYLPYLNQWTSMSSLAELITIMCSVFSEEPPVFRKDPNQVISHPPKSNPNPQLHNANITSSTSSSSSSSSSSSFQHQHPHSNPHTPAPSHTPSPAPVLPPKPIFPHSSQSSSSSHQQLNALNLQLSTPPSSSSASNQHSPSSSVPVSSSIQLPASPNVIVAPRSNNRAEQKQQLVQHVTSSLRSFLIKYHTENTAQIEHLLRIQHDLTQSSNAIASEQARLDAYHAELTVANQDMNSKCNQIQEWLEKYEHLELPHVDKLVYPKDSWSKQLLEAVCEDQAIEDTLYCLDRALADDRIDLQNFLKITRALARKQFAARALAIKIQSKLAEKNAISQGAFPTLNNSASRITPPPPYGASSAYSNAPPVYR